MAAEGEAGRLVVRLETSIDVVVGSGGPARLAFSGGLGSLLVASVARKRCDLTCFITATEDAPDFARASVLRSYLDYRLEIVRPTITEAVDLARRAAHDRPSWTTGQILDALPVLAVITNTRGNLFSGHGASHVSGSMRRWLALRDVSLPLLDSIRGSSRVRARLISAGRVLGIPDEFLRVAPLSPSVGSGLRPFLAEAARDSKISLRTLLNPRSGPGVPSHRILTGRFKYASHK
jgi:hypothetical protein